jgi:hypothetical protein
MMGIAGFVLDLIEIKRLFMTWRLQMETHLQQIPDVAVAWFLASHSSDLTGVSLAQLSKGLTLGCTKFVQAFLYISLSHCILQNISGEDSFTVNLMTLSVSHISAGQHLSLYYNQEKDLTSFTAMIGRLL